MKISLTAPINRVSYGLTSLNILKVLARTHEVALFPIGNPEAENPDDHPLIRTCLSNQEFYSSRAPSIRIWHQHDLAQHIGKFLHIGFPIFEINKFQPNILNHLLNQDGLLVTSEWGKRVLEENNVPTPIFVVPLGVDNSVFNYQKLPQDGICRFLNVGKWELRKGHNELLEAFNRAFDVTDKVELIMMPISSHTTQTEMDEWGNIYKSSKLGDKIKILPPVSTPQLVNIMRTVDCGVFPSRAEGWNLPLLEMMACGKQVIATNYSAHTEFCNIENCLLIDIDELEDAYDGRWFRGFGEWAALEDKQIDQCAEYMKLVYKSKTLGADVINLKGIETAKKFSWENTCNKLMGAVTTLAPKLA